MTLAWSVWIRSQDRGARHGRFQPQAAPDSRAACVLAPAGLGSIRGAPVVGLAFVSAPHARHQRFVSQPPRLVDGLLLCFERSHRFAAVFKFDLIPNRRGRRVAFWHGFDKYVWHGDPSMMTKVSFRMSWRRGVIQAAIEKIVAREWDPFVGIAAEPATIQQSTRVHCDDRGGMHGRRKQREELVEGWTEF